MRRGRRLVLDLCNPCCREVQPLEPLRLELAVARLNPIDRRQRKGQQRRGAAGRHAEARQGAQQLVQCGHQLRHRGDRQQPVDRRQQADQHQNAPTAFPQAFPAQAGCPGRQGFARSKAEVEHDDTEQQPAQPHHTEAQPPQRTGLGDGIGGDQTEGQHQQIGQRQAAERRRDDDQHQHPGERTQATPGARRHAQPSRDIRLRASSCWVSLPSTSTSPSSARAISASPMST